MKLKLSARSVAALETTGQRYVVHDTAVVGLQIRVNANGTKTAAVAYRRGTKICRYTLGKISESYPFAKARAGAVAALLIIKDGGDPAKDKRALKDSPTLEEVAQRFMTEHVAVHCKKRGQESYETLLRLHVLPNLGRSKVIEITRADIEFVHRKVGVLRPGAANRMLTMLSSLFGKCEDWGLIPNHTNPVRGVKRYREEKRDRTLSPQERARLDEQLTIAEATATRRKGHVSRGHIDAFRLLFLTGARRNEILTLQWPMVDFERGELRLPDSKTGRKAIPLSAQAAAYLQAIWQRRQQARETGEALSEWVCATSKGKRLRSLNRAWLALRKAAGLDDVWLHDLRRSAATDAFSAGVPIGLVGGILGHASPATTARYALVVDEPKRLAAQRMGDAIAAQTQAGRAALAAATLPPEPATPEVVVVVLTGKTDIYAVWGPDEQSTTERWFPSFEEAHTFVMNRKAEGCEIAYVDERPLSAIGETADD